MKTTKILAIGLALCAASLEVQPALAISGASNSVTATRGYGGGGNAVTTTTTSGWSTDPGSPMQGKTNQPYKSGSGMDAGVGTTTTSTTTCTPPVKCKSGFSVTADGCGCEVDNSGGSNCTPAQVKAGCKPI